MMGRCLGIANVAALLLVCGFCSEKDEDLEQVFMRQGGGGGLGEVLKMALDNTDLEAMHEKAEAIRRGDALPEPPERWWDDISNLDEESLQQKRSKYADMAKFLVSNQIEQVMDGLAVAGNTSNNETRRLEALELLQDLVSEIDIAKDFKTIEGFEAMSTLLLEPSDELQVQTLWVVGTAVQNAQELQLHVVQKGLLLQVLQLLADSQSAAVRSRALYCIAGTLQNCPKCAQFFLYHAGLQVLQKASQAADARMKVKLVTLVSDLAPSLSDTTAGDIAWMCPLMADLMQSQHPDKIDKALDANQALPWLQCDSWQRDLQATRQLSNSELAKDPSNDIWRDLREKMG